MYRICPTMRFVFACVGLFGVEFQNGYFATTPRTLLLPCRDWQSLAPNQLQLYRKFFFNFHFEGLWGVAVQAAKTLALKSISNANLTDEPQTESNEVEAIRNSWPATLMSDNPNDVQALAPAHRNGSPLSSIPKYHLCLASSTNTTLGSMAKDNLLKATILVIVEARLSSLNTTTVKMV